MTSLLTGDPGPRTLPLSRTPRLPQNLPNLPRPNLANLGCLPLEAPRREEGLTLGDVVGLVDWFARGLGDLGEGRQIIRVHKQVRPSYHRKLGGYLESPCVQLRTHTRRLHDFVLSLRTKLHEAILTSSSASILRSRLPLSLRMLTAASASFWVYGSSSCLTLVEMSDPNQPKCV